MDFLGQVPKEIEKKKICYVKSFRIKTENLSSFIFAPITDV